MWDKGSPLPSAAADPEQPAAGEAAPSAVGPQRVHVEVMLDGHRITGSVHYSGPPRRLVDIMNSLDSGVIVMHDCEMDDPFDEAASPQRFEFVQVDLDSILYVVPREADLPQHGDAVDTVRKDAVPSTIVMPGLEIRGSVFFLPGADPSQVILFMSGRRFTPVADARVRADHGHNLAWRIPLIVVNTRRVLVFGRDKG